MDLNSTPGSKQNNQITNQDKGNLKNFFETDLNRMSNYSNFIDFNSLKNSKSPEDLENKIGSFAGRIDIFVENIKNSVDPISSFKGQNESQRKQSIDSFKNILTSNFLDNLKDISNILKKQGKDNSNVVEVIKSIVSLKQFESDKKYLVKDPSSPQNKLENKTGPKIKSSSEVIDSIISYMSSETIDKTFFTDNSKNFFKSLKDDLSTNLKDAVTNVQQKLKNYQNEPGKKQSYIDRAKAFSSEMGKHIQELLQNKEINSDVLKVWLNPDKIGDSKSVTDRSVGFYDDITKANYQKNLTEDQWKSITVNYRKQFIDLAKSYNLKQLSTQESLGSGEVKDVNQIPYGFLHINGQNDRGKGTDLRCYITTNLLKDPSKAISVWKESLEESGLKDSLYYKTTAGLVPNKNTAQRLDQIVIYKNDTINDDQFKKLLELFENKCKNIDPDLLAKDDQMMPAANKIGQGISIAPEPDYINDYLRFTDNKNSKHSYNTFIQKMMGLSIGIAKERLGGNIKSIDDKGMKEEVKKVFEEFMKLSKINPDTMLPEQYGNDLPSWTKLNN